jgi:hypothetical protein
MQCSKNTDLSLILRTHQENPNGRIFQEIAGLGFSNHQGQKVRKTEESRERQHLQTSKTIGQNKSLGRQLVQF